MCTEEAMRATQWLEKQGISVQHVHVTTLKPFTDPLIVETLKKSKIWRCDNGKSYYYRWIRNGCWRSHFRQPIKYKISQSRY
ncbi:hypothetical protein [Enterococcus rivorum]|uniref:hypothetical protein n=1 Tax=Enterococcus rivorum TaxID=762845 RepID=UPI00362BB570